MSIWIPSATHRGAPFVGRGREIGLLTNLLDEGLRSNMGLVAVASAAGMGRRRLLAEALAHGPDAEWVHLAPGGVEPDFRRWARTELIDLLDTYPEAPYPSWALHTVARWAPRLAARAPVPSYSRERLEPDREPEMMGAAVAALLRVLTGHTLVLVDVGIWPQGETYDARVLQAMDRVLAEPGALMVGAASLETGRKLSEAGARVLELGPLRARDVLKLTTAWHPGGDTGAFAGWLHRATAGHPLFIHETVRWLEEMGHVRVNDDHKTVELLSALSRLPVPLFLRGVMDDRYRRLDRSAARLLHLLCSVDGRLEREALRRRSRTDDEAFDEALAALRRREFLLKRTSRRPLAVANPLWVSVVEDNVTRFPRKGYRRRGLPPERNTGSSPLARISTRLKTVSVKREHREAAVGTLASAWRMAHGRPGSAWSGIRGRVAVLAAEIRRRQKKPAQSERWARRGLAELDPDIFPGLRRSCSRQLAIALEETKQTLAADAVREAALSEAADAGHPIAAAWLEVVTAETLRRRGHLREAFSRARWGSTLDQMELPLSAERARLVTLSAVIEQFGLAAGEPWALASLQARNEEWPGALGAALYGAPLQNDDGSASDEVQFARYPVSWWENPEHPAFGWGLDAQSSFFALKEKLARFLWPVLWGENSDPLDWPDEASPEHQNLLSLTHWEVHVWDALSKKNTAKATLALDRLAELHATLHLPVRARATAEALRKTAAVGLPNFKSYFSAWMNVPGSDAPPPKVPSPNIALILTGRPGVFCDGLWWPKSLWPVWWTRLWSEVLLRDGREDPISREQAEEILKHAPDAPEESLESVLLRGNELVRGPHHITGGLYLDKERVVMNWSGIHCDLAHFRAAPPSNPDWDVLQNLWGRLLPGVDEEIVVRARAEYETEVVLAVKNHLARLGPPDPPCRLRLLDALGWLPEVRDLLLALRGSRQPLPEARHASP